MRSVVLKLHRSFPWLNIVLFHFVLSFFFFFLMYDLYKMLYEQIKVHTSQGWAINRFYRLTRMCSLRRLVWMKIGFLFNIRRRSPLGSHSSEWAQPSPCAFAICWPIDDRCVRLEAVTVRAIKDLTDPYVFVSLSRYFDVTQGSFCTALLQVEHTWCHRPPITDGW